MSEGVKVDVENMDGNITSSAATTTTTKAMTEAIHDETNNDGMKEEKEEEVREIKADEVEAIRTTMSIPTLSRSLPLENINTSAAPEVSFSDVSVNSNEEIVSEESFISLSKPSIACRICLMNEDCERLLSPCQCKGTHGFVHRQCLEYWLSRSGLSHCELCLYRFSTAYQLRYGLWESMRIWFSHPSNRALLQSDILLCTLLTIITFGLVVASMFGMYYLAATHSIQTEATRYWTETSIGVFLGIVVFALVLNTIVVVKANILPWYRWWQRCRETQLVIQDNNNANV